MERRLVVSTECPTCAAPLDFSEGSNAVQCHYCQSNLLVTGRKQLLSYYIEPRVEPREAARAVFGACRNQGWRAKAVGWKRYFIPYYRLTGHDLRWEQAEAEREQEAIGDPELQCESALTEFQYAAGIARSLAQALPSCPDSRSTQVLRDRYVDKNFIACDLRGATPYSVGVRLAVLRLRLFRRDAIRPLGGIVAPVLTPEAALSQGMQTVAMESGILHRKVLGRSLSVVYYPFCAVEIERDGAAMLSVVDGVSGTVVRLDAPLATNDILSRELVEEPASVGFRPLVCPNCGWNLPVNPEHVVFFCASCEQAWQIYGSELHEVPYRTCTVPDVPQRDSSTAPLHLPFWVLDDAGLEGDRRQLYLPAFRYRRLKILVDLARELSGRERRYSLCKLRRPDLHGCYYDQEDAACLAEITYPELTATPERALQRLQEDQLSFSQATLTWFPFRVEGDLLRDPFTQRAISRRLLA